MSDPTPLPGPSHAVLLNRRTSIAGAAALLLTACGGGDGTRVVVLPPAPQPAKTPVELAVEQLDTLVQLLHTRTGVPGLSVAVVHKGKTLYAKGFGVRKAGESAPVDADTVFQLASVSKSLAATVVARQVGEGVVRWTSPVHPYLPEFELSNPQSTARVTVGDLFSHRSGLGDHAGDQLEEIGYGREDVFVRLRHVPVEPLGTHYDYTNFGLTAAAVAVANAAGAEWEDLSDRTLYRPLGMTRTSSRFADFIGNPNHAVGHMRIDGEYQAYRVRQPDAQSPAGGVSSSAADMARWMTLILNKGTYNGQRLIDASALQAALTAQPDAQASYGYGFNVGHDPAGHRTVSHSGAFALGAGTTHMMWPDEELGIAVLTNAQPRGLAEAIAASFSELAFGNPISQDWLAFFDVLMQPLYKKFGSLVGQTAPNPAQPPKALASYAGRYANAYYGDALVQVNGQALELRMGPDSQVLHTLRHWSGDQFVFDLASENAEPGSLSWIRFVPATPGVAAHLQIEYYAQDLAQGRFEKRASEAL